MKAYLLAAGYATRLYPLTRTQPKPLLEVGGKPLLTHLAEKILEIGDVSEFIVIGNARFADQFEAWARDSNFGVPARVLNDGSTEESNRLGAIGDIAFAIKQAPPGAEDWIVAAGDNLLDFDLKSCYGHFRAKRRPTLIVREVKLTGGPSPYNEVALDAKGNVTSFREKPKDPKTNLAAIGFYFFTPEIAAKVGQYLAGGGNPDAPGYFIEWLVKHAPVAAIRCKGRWFDIGSLESLEKAREEFGKE